MCKKDFSMYDIIYITMKQNVQNNRAFDFHNLAKIQNNVAINIMM